jgi:ABC-2 type transport system ATP-binding protein
MSITVTDLTKTYGSQRAIDNISFEVETGEILGFLGPNGAGKSTTMKIITCFLKPTSGSVSLNGYSIHEHSRAIRRRIGYLPEHTPLYTDMAIVDYLKLSAELQGVPSSQVETRVREMIDLCGLGPERHKRIGELSKGYRQRVGLAQALIHDPEVLILDEPTTGLDPNQIVEIRSLIKEIGRKKTVMLSSHILKEVEATCDRILIINRGRLVADGSTEELRRRATGADQLRIQLKADGADTGGALKALPSIAAIRPGEKGAHSWVVDARPESDPREDIFHLCVDKGWVLTEMTPIESSLEDIFRELTENQS